MSQPPAGAAAPTSRPRPLKAAVLGVALGFAVAPLGAGAACREPPARADLLADSVFVEVMARLAFLREEAKRRGAPVQARDDASRRAVLEEYGVTEDQLRRHAAERGRDPEHMQRTWEEVARMVDSLSRAGTAREPALRFDPGDAEEEEGGGAGGGQDSRAGGAASASGR